MGPGRARKKNQRLTNLKGPDPRRGHAFTIQQQKRIGREESVFFFCRAKRIAVRFRGSLAGSQWESKKPQGNPPAAETLRGTLRIPEPARRLGLPKPAEWPQNMTNS